MLPRLDPHAPGLRVPMLLGGAGALAALLTAETFIWEPLRVGVDRWTLPVRHLPDGLVGLTIAHLSDFHVRGRGWRVQTTRRAVALAMTLRADMIALTGDFVDTNTAAPLLLDVLAPLRAPLGVFAVLGNHDYYHNARRPHLVTRALSDLGFHLLLNTARPVWRGGACLWVGGVGDDLVGQADPAAAAAAIPPATHPRLLLCHRPDVVDRLPIGQWDIMLSGHTHGAQINLPILGRVMVRRTSDSNYMQGLYRVRDTTLLVSRGIGTVGLPGRLCAPPQVNLVRLVSAPSADSADQTPHRR